MASDPIGSGKRKKSRMRIKSSDCKDVILIGETAIYNRIKRFLDTKKNGYVISCFKSDNENKTIFCEQKRNETKLYLTSIYDELIGLTEPTLVINCGCYYIYPPALIQKDNLCLINFHNGLLPQYRGLNIPSWVIYNGESQAGITWHLIREKIDAGEIIKRGSISIKEDEKAYQLCKRLFDLGYDLFVELWEEWCTGRLSSIEPQSSSMGSRFYYGKSIPNNGVVDLRNTDPESIYNTLRALDYGKLALFPPVRLIDKEGKEHILFKYWRDKELLLEDRDILKLAWDDGYLYFQVSKDQES